MSYKPRNAVVWVEIPTADMDRAKAFYSEVFGFDMQMEKNAPNPMANFPTADQSGVAGHIYPGTPAGDGRGPTIHMAVPGKLEDTIAKWKKAGGELVMDDPVTIPPGRFVYATDLDGNSIGLFEMAS